MSTMAWVAVIGWGIALLFCLGIVANIVETRRIRREIQDLDRKSADFDARMAANRRRIMERIAEE